MRQNWSDRRRVLTGCAIISVLLLLLLCGSLAVAVMGMNKSMWIGNGTSYLVIVPYHGNDPIAALESQSPENRIYLGSSPTWSHVICQSDDILPPFGGIEVMKTECHQSP